MLRPVYDKIVARTIRLADISQMESPSQFVDQNSGLSRFGTDRSSLSPPVTLPRWMTRLVLAQ